MSFVSFVLMSMNMFPKLLTKLARHEDLTTDEAAAAMAEIIEVPAGLTEEAVKGAVVFEAAQLSRLNDAGEGAAAGAENPGAGQRPEGGETGLGKAGLKSEQEGSKGAEEEIRHGRVANLSYLL